MEVKGHPKAAAESSSRAHSAAADKRPAVKEADGGLLSKEAGDVTARGRPPLSEAAVSGEEIAAEEKKAREGESLREPEVDGEGVKKPSGDGLKNAATGGDVHKKPTADEAGPSADEPKQLTADEAGPSADEPKQPTADEAGPSAAEPKQPSGRSVPVRALCAGLGAIGERMQGVSASIAAYHGSLAHLSQYLQRVATYAPNSGTAGPGPAVLTSVARACGNIGALLADAASTVQGATSIGLLLGAGLRHVSRIYGLDAEPEPEPKPEAAFTGKTKIIISTVEQAQKVINWIGDELGVEVDVDLDVTPWMAVKIYEEFRSAGILSLISGGSTMKSKRTAFYEKKE